VDERSARAERGVVREELRREVVRAVHDDVDRADEREGVPRVEAEIRASTATDGKIARSRARRGGRLALSGRPPP
jgi:hypothetical protein